MFRRFALVRPMALLAALLPLGIKDAPAQSTTPGAVFKADTVTLSLVAEPPAADGRFRAALTIDLEPGWKTYWIDPGEAGIPPMIDTSQSRNAELEEVGYPAPGRYEEAGFETNGYSAPLAVALTLRKPKPADSASLAVSVFLGVCHDVCIPVQAELSLDPDTAPNETGAVEAAFAALPRRDEAASDISGASLDPDMTTLSVETTLAPTQAHDADLFVAGPKGWTFGSPAEIRSLGGRTVFEVPVLEKPRKEPSSALAVDAVMTLGETAVEARELAVAIKPRT
ncbi:protein-disulfide reductase DsbD domain-containing protein [Consotaella aegiceratis]|uniref:protein-disulfide reductase DsbD domain-containing protein n=1 Tax=Consotaella aegiceratis TaxID=3097961 RepID=UPI002F3F6F6D